MTKSSCAKSRGVHIITKRCVLVLHVILRCFSLTDLIKALDKINSTVTCWGSVAELLYYKVKYWLMGPKCPCTWLFQCPNAPKSELTYFLLKGVVYDFNPKEFYQIQRISPHDLLAFRSLCALKKQSGVHSQPWLCKQSDSRRATNPGHQIPTL